MRQYRKKLECLSSADMVSGVVASTMPKPLDSFSKPDGNVDVLAYHKDLGERSILFLDTLRERANVMLSHERNGLPPLLDFEYETVLDARKLTPPVNYMLLRIVAVGDECWDNCVDPAKPPVIVLDPRAGHGPGIGGFKRDSEVGMALHVGHPVYFVIFFPEPIPGQTIKDVHNALRQFVVAVSDRHPGTPPILYGNCQAGWAATLLAADCVGLVGPVVLNGSPLSYWAGESGANPMRLTGGLLGGVWITHLMADLCDGRFDGAWLAQNFENLKPEKAVFEKYANLLTNVDTERERFLEFERWWNGFYFLSREEIVAIVENLFIGNRLESGELMIMGECHVNLRAIRNPMVVFASWGDNITPPYQALGWIPAVYSDSADLKAAGQRIVYLTNPHVGHLGIFVSASVARMEHRAILEHLDEIEALPPGLYQMNIDNPTGNPDCQKSQYVVHFEERLVEDLKIPPIDPVFDRVRRLSERNETFYQQYLSPAVMLLSNPWLAETLKWMHPMRARIYLTSEKFNPWMNLVRNAADAVRQAREPMGHDHPLLQAEQKYLQQTNELLEALRELRDAWMWAGFQVLFGAEGSRNEQQKKK